MGWVARTLSLMEWDIPDRRRLSPGLAWPLRRVVSTHVVCGTIRRRNFHVSDGLLTAGARGERHKSPHSRRRPCSQNPFHKFNIRRSYGGLVAVVMIGNTL